MQPNHQWTGHGRTRSRRQYPATAFGFRRVTVLLGLLGGLAGLAAATLPTARAAASGTTERVSVATGGTQADNISGRRGAPASSTDGRFVAFDSLASNLVSGDTNAIDDVFVRDRQADTTERVSVASDGSQGDGPSPSAGIRGGATFGPAISADGSLVAFDSSATNLVPGDTSTCVNPGTYSFTTPGSCPDVFVRNRQAGTTERVSVDSAGGQANDASTDPAISGDGSVVAFFSAASNLVAGDSNACTFPAVSFSNGHCPDIFAHTR